MVRDNPHTNDSHMDDSQGSARLTVEVAYALSGHQEIVRLEVEQGTTAYEAVLQSGLCARFPMINIDSDTMGIFSRVLNGKEWPTPDKYILQENDRVEIYRPLIMDPKQARLARAAKAKEGSKSKSK